MTARFKTALALLVGLAATVAIVVIFLGVFDDKSPEDAEMEGARTAVDGAGPGADITVGTSGPTNGATLEGGVRNGTPGSGLVTPGMRTPHGLDLSDADERHAYLAKLMKEKPLNWTELARVLRVSPDRLPDEIRDFLLQAIRGGSKNFAMKAFRVLADGSMAKDLVALLDDPALDTRTNAAVLQALYSMPGANPDEVALALEARLKDDFAKDRLMIQAIAARGGTEATRAIVDYIRRMDKPGLINSFHVQDLDLSGNKEAQAVVIEALKEGTWKPAALRQILGLTAKPGNEVFSEAVIALDASGQPDDVRKEALKTLSGIGGKDALAHLIKRAAQPGEYGAQATKALEGLRYRDDASVALLGKELDAADRNPRPEAYRAAVLRAIGNLRDETNAEKVVTYFNDPSPNVSRMAIRAIGRLETKGDKYVPQLAQRWTTAETATRQTIVIALGSIGGTSSVTALEEMKKELLDSEAPDKSLLRTVSAAIVHAKKRIARGDSRPAVGPGLGGGR